MAFVERPSTLRQDTTLQRYHADINNCRDSEYAWHNLDKSLFERRIAKMGHCPEQFSEVTAALQGDDERYVCWHSLVFIVNACRHVDCRYTQAINEGYWMYKAWDKREGYDLREQETAMFTAHDWAQMSENTARMASTGNLAARHWDTTWMHAPSEKTPHSMNMHIWGASMALTPTYTYGDCRYIEQIGGGLTDIRMKLVNEGTIGRNVRDTTFAFPLTGIRDVNLSHIMTKDLYLKAMQGLLQKCPLNQQTLQCLRKGTATKTCKLRGFGLLCLTPRDRREVAPFLHSDHLYPKCMYTVPNQFMSGPTITNQFKPLQTNMIDNGCTVQRPRVHSSLQQHRHFTGFMTCAVITEHPEQPNPLTTDIYAGTGNTMEDQAALLPVCKQHKSQLSPGKKIKFVPEIGSVYGMTDSVVHSASDCRGAPDSGRTRMIVYLEYQFTDLECKIWRDPDQLDSWKWPWLQLEKDSTWPYSEICMGRPTRLTEFKACRQQYRFSMDQIAELAARSVINPNLRGPVRVRQQSVEEQQMDIDDTEMIDFSMVPLTNRVHSDCTSMFAELTMDRMNVDLVVSELNAKEKWISKEQFMDSMRTLVQRADNGWYLWADNLCLLDTDSDSSL